MTKSQPQDEPTRALVKCFCSFIFRLKLLHYIYCELFEDDSALYLTEQTADAFFFDLSNILVDYFLLEVAKLTDPATSLSGKCENFTIANLIETIEWPADCLQKIEELNETVQLFRTYIKPARNKLLAHYDKKAVISGATFGGFPEGEELKLLVVLEQVCNVMHEAAFGEIYGDIQPSHNGDVRDLKKALKRAIAFKKLFNESKGEERKRLYCLLKDVDSHSASGCTHGKDS